MSGVKKIADYINKNIFGIKETFTLDRKVLLMLTSYSVILCLFALFVNYYSNVNMIVQSITVISLLMMILLNYLSRKRGHKRGLTWIFIIFSNISLSAAWFVNGGYDGSVVFIVIFLFMASLIITDNSRRWIIFIIYLTMISVLYLTHYFRPETITDYFYNSRADRFADIFLTLLYSMLLIYLITDFIMRSINQERKKAESEKIKAQEANSRLNMINHDLDKLNEELAEANYTKNKFLSIISHDLRNPLGAIKNYSELIRLNDKASSVEKLELANNLEKSVNFVLELLENILLWSRSQSNHISFSPETVNCSDFARICISNLEPIARIKNITLSFESVGKAEVIADLNMLNTVIRNLITNAIKFTNPGGSVMVSVKKESHDFISFCVQDTGVGISPEDLNKLFRLDTHYTTKGTGKERGTGLGLLLCKEFIEKNGGKIHVSSRLGVGSCFIFTLPAVNKQEIFE